MLGAAVGPEVSAPIEWLTVLAIVVVLPFFYPRRLPRGLREIDLRARAATAGALLGVLAVLAQPWGPVLRGPVAVDGIVASAATGDVAEVEVHRHAPIGAGWRREPGRIRVDFGRSPPFPGERVLVWGDAGPLPRQALPGEPDPVRLLRRSRVRTVLEARQFEPIGGVATADDPFRGFENGPFLRALATGERGDLPPEQWRLLQDTGTAHLLAVSGFHVALLTGLSAGLVAWLARLAGVARVRGVPTWPAGAVAAAVAWSFAAAVGSPVSALRAAGAAIVVAGARWFGRDPPLLDVLAVVAGAQALAEPASVGTASFHLSYGAMLGLLLVTPRLTRWIPPDTPTPLTWCAQALAASLGATVGTLGPMAFWFQSLPPWSPIANLFAVPLAGLILTPMTLVMVVAPAPVAAAIGVVADPGVDVLLAGLAPFATVWHPAVGPVGAAGLALVPWLARRPAWATALAAVCLAAPGPRPPSGLRATVLDVGQGTSVFVEQADGTTLLVDGGPSRRPVLRWLRRRGVRRVDVVVATHGHPDHTTGLAAVLLSVDVGALWIPDTRGMDALLQVARARGIPVVVRPPAALHPRGTFQGSQNDASLVLGWPGALLLPGDVEAAGEAALAHAPVRADVLVAAHHGSRTSTGADLLDRVAPRLVIAGTGADNPYGHPHPEVVNRVRDHGAVWLDTAAVGTVEVEIDDVAVQVRRWRAGLGWSDRIRWLRAPRQRHRRPDRDDSPHDGQALGGRQRGPEELPSFVAAKQLHYEPHGGVPADPRHGDPPVRPRPGDHDVRDGRDEHEADGLVQLRRVHGDVLGRLGVGGVKTHRPRKVGGAAVATTCGETAEARERMAEGEGRREHVEDLDHRELAVPHHQERRGQPGEERAVEHEAPGAHVDPVGGGGRGGRVLEHEQRPRTCETRQRRPEDHVDDVVRRVAERARAAEDQEHDHHEADGGQGAVRMDGEAADVEQDRVHPGALSTERAPRDGADHRCGQPDDLGGAEPTIEEQPPRDVAAERLDKRPPEPPRHEQRGRRPAIRVAPMADRADDEEHPEVHERQVQRSRVQRDRQPLVRDAPRMVDRDRPRHVETEGKRGGTTVAAPGTQAPEARDRLPEPDRRRQGVERSGDWSASSPRERGGAGQSTEQPPGVGPAGGQGQPRPRVAPIGARRLDDDVEQPRPDRPDDHAGEHGVEHGGAPQPRSVGLAEQDRSGRHDRSADRQRVGRERDVAEQPDPGLHDATQAVAAAAGAGFSSRNR